MKLLTALLTVALTTVAVQANAVTTIGAAQVKSAQCMIGQTFFDCTKATSILGTEAVTEIKFGDNQTWVVNRSWNDVNSRASFKSANKHFKVETYWRDEDLFHVVPFSDATEYDWECFKVKGSSQDFCWKENFS
jgi:hypothetical protein